MQVWLGPSLRAGDPDGTWRGRVLVERLNGYHRVATGKRTCWAPNIRTTMNTALVLIEGATVPVSVRADTGEPFHSVLFSAHVFESTSVAGARTP